jgi:protein-L-isoaspartate(D-aspartate) O-methyltransferase
MTSPPPRGPKFPLRLDQLKQPAKRFVTSGDGNAVSTPKPLARPLAQMAENAGQRSAKPATSSPATGMGLDSADVRMRMVQRLRAEGLKSAALLQALAVVERHRFVDAALITQAYEDTSLPIGHGQTISKPSVVARMIEILMDGANVKGTGGLGKVLEIGTGCGYQAAVLSLLAHSVISVERLKPLHDKARELLAPTRSTKLRLVYGDGMLGHPPNAPYDSIISAAGGDELPQSWLDQLAVGGRLVSPVRQRASGQQALVVVDRNDRGYEHRIHEAVNFVPLKSGMAG